VTGEANVELKTIPGLSAVEQAAMEPPTGTADTGTKEAELLTQNLDPKEIAKRTAENEHNRTERFRDHFERVSIIGLWVVAALMAFSVAFWFWHVLFPVSWHWLNAEQVSKLQTLVAGGVIASTATGHLKRRLGG
jgi:hypothetical protein